MKVSIRKKDLYKRNKVSEKLYQINIDKSSDHMKHNGLEFSTEKKNKF